MSNRDRTLRVVQTTAESRCGGGAGASASETTARGAASSCTGFSAISTFALLPASAGASSTSASSPGMCSDQLYLIGDEEVLVHGNAGWVRVKNETPFRQYPTCNSIFLG